MAENPPKASTTEQTLLRVPVAEETVSVGTRTVETGRVRIQKTVAEHPVVIDERLLKEALEVNRVPVDRLVAPGEAPSVRYEGDTLVVPVLEEVLVVERRVRIKEELRITTARREERHVETVTLKSEQVSVERFNDADEPPGL